MKSFPFFFLLIATKVFIFLGHELTLAAAATTSAEQELSSLASFNDQQELGELAKNHNVIREAPESSSSWYSIPWGFHSVLDKFVSPRVESATDRFSGENERLLPSWRRKRRRPHDESAASAPNNDNKAAPTWDPKSKSNPLIERTLERGAHDNMDVDADDDDDDAVVDETDDGSHRWPTSTSSSSVGPMDTTTKSDLVDEPLAPLRHNDREPSKYHRVGPASSFGAAEIHGGKNRFRNRNDWCHRDCNTNINDNNNINGRPKHHHSVCGSDGHLYGSMCELRRHACRHDIYLFKKPKASCRFAEPKPFQSIANHHRQQNGSQEVRIVDLKQRCQRAEYDEMKLLLLREFNRDISSMFKYFDSNGDGSIEAHELWPKRDTNKLLYAQAWDEHSNHCSGLKYSHHHHHYHARANERFTRGAESQTSDNKCWFFLDFAFEPHVPTNPCSLSHLMLFDLRHPNNKFQFDTFEMAFEKSIAQFEEKFHEPVALPERDPFKKYTLVKVGLGDSITLRCTLNLSDISTPPSIEANTIDVETNNNNDEDIRCFWSRYNTNLASTQDAHISIRRVTDAMNKNSPELQLVIEDAQLYLSGQFKCACHSKKIERTFDHLYSVQVIAKPRVDVRPKFQWSLPSSRISFECHYDYIDTSQSDVVGDNGQPCDEMINRPPDESEIGQLDERGQFGMRIKWLKEDEQFIVDSKNFNATQKNLDDSGSEEQITVVANLSERSSITMAASRLTMENLSTNDTGHYTCRVNVPTNTCNNINARQHQQQQQLASARLALSGQNEGMLLVQDRPLSEAPDETAANEAHQLWMFHDNGISIYRLQSDDGQEMELLREINGHSMVSGEVDGNWNQLTLCGGLNPEQVVICEWSDNALHIDVEQAKMANDKSSARVRRYIYVGQPNLNRVIVMDGSKFEIVAIINTEPQPRKLFLYQPSKIHLSKWVRRRLSPAANARWLSAIGTHAHSLKSTPKSNLYSNKPVTARHPMAGQTDQNNPSGQRARRSLARQPSSRTGLDGGASSSANQLPSSLIQHDIWLLCYGQPLVLDPTGDEHLEDVGRFHSTFGEPPTQPSGNTSDHFSAASTISISGGGNNALSHKQPQHHQQQQQQKQQTSRANGPVEAPPLPLVQPFTPRLSAGPQFAWSVWLNKEAKLRNRKSVHIIQSTFFPQSILAPSHHASLHHHHHHHHNHYHVQEDLEINSRSNNQGAGIEGNERKHSNLSVVGEFKKSTVITTHHIFTGYPASSTKIAQQQQQQQQQQQLNYLNRGAGRFDLIHDLYVPAKPYSLADNGRHKIHHAYVTHYDDRRLFRVSMDEYRYDREIDLQNCDPIKMITTAQGLLVVQCRAPITHQLMGQMVLDQLTSSRIEFNADVKAQESYLSPDHRYLVSVFTNSTPASFQPHAISNNSNSSRLAFEGRNDSNKQQQKRGAAIAEEAIEKRRQSVVYVQMVSVSGLKLQYEIKTSLEISQCSFVWKDGYYAAIFVSTNRRDEQSEILSLRLADSRLELMARVPGLISATRHKEQLIVSPELRLAALSTNQGTYVVDLEENRVLQSMRHHQSPPTLLWL